MTNATLLDYRQTAANLRAAREGTEPCATRTALTQAIRLVMADDSRRPTDADVEAIGDMLEAEFVGAAIPRTREEAIAALVESCVTRTALTQAIRLAMADDSRRPTDADVEAIGDMLYDLSSGG